MLLQCAHCQTTWHSPDTQAHAHCPTCGAYTSAAPLAQPIVHPTQGAPSATPVFHGGQLQPPPPPPIAAPTDWAESVDDAIAQTPPLDEADALPPRRFPFAIVLFLFLFFLLLAAGVAAVFLLARMKPTPHRAYNPWDDNTSQYVSSSPVDADQPIQWRSVDEGGLILGPARVEIVRAEFGEARGRDASGAVIISERDYVSILVRIENFGRQPLHYRSWYGNEFKADDATVRVRLWDDSSRQYAWILFDDVVSVRWHTPSATIETGQSIEDLMIFDVPEGVDRASVRSLRIELPAAAVGEQGFYHFELPRTMVEDF